MAERSKALDWNSSNILTGVRGFESHSLRHFRGKKCSARQHLRVVANGDVAEPLRRTLMSIDECLDALRTLPAHRNHFALSRGRSG
jgi:hypothetical protein